MAKHIFKSEAIKAAFIMFQFMRDKSSDDLANIQSMMNEAMAEAFERGFTMGQEVMLDALQEQPLPECKMLRIVGGTYHADGTSEV